MTLRMIIGRAGTGKTRACLDEIRRELLACPDGPPLILLVPEQATFQTEYALASSAGLKGFMRAQVLSFRRLAYRVLLEVGGAARAHIGELGKRMMLRRLLEQHRGKLKVFRRSAGQPGFAGTLASALGEMKTYCIQPADLAVSLDALRERESKSLLADKLADISFLYEAMESYLAGRFTDPDDYLNLLADGLVKTAAIKEAEVWVDGFSGFTPQEYRVLAALMRLSRRVTVTLCAGAAALSGSPDESDLFYPARETYDALCALAAREQVAVERPLLLNPENTRFRNAAIAYLESNFFRRPANPARPAGDGVMLAAAANRRAEVEGVAREIIRLCRDHGYRYREIVLLTRDLDAYDHLLSVVFADHGIPVFIDRKRPVLGHPLVELVRAALEVVVKDWSYDPVFRFLKTDLAPLSREEVDLLENYVLAHGIRGSRWYDAAPWEYRRRLTLEEDTAATADEAGELAEINRIRRAAVDALAGFHQAVRQAGKAREITVALFNLLSDLQVASTLESWSRQAEAAGMLEAAREHGQVWDMLVTLLDQVVEAMGEESLKPADYAVVLDAGLENMRLSLIPPGLDQVVAGSLERSRSPEARAAFILGVNESVLPARVTGQGVLSEDERERLRAVGLNLSPGARRKVFEEQYLVYIALTRASERLTLSYLSADDEGGAKTPSTVIARVKELLPEVEERVWPVAPDAAGGAGDLEFITHPDRCLSYLPAQLREVKAGRAVDPVWLQVYNWFAAGTRREDCARALSGLFYANREERLPPGAVKLLYGQPFKTSVSGIEKFRSCPFAHFLAQGLRLRDRAVFRLGAPDLGQFFHAALKLYGDRIQHLGLDWGDLPPQDCRQIAGEVVDFLAPRLQSEILLSSARQRYLTGKIKRTVQRAVLVLSEHARRGKFRPVGLELTFGPAGELPAITFMLADGSEMLVTGRIDRVDAARGDAGVYLRVIDYKSGRVTINLSEIFHGLKLQLLTYLEVALRQADKLAGGAGLPGAIFYFRLDDPLIKTDGAAMPDEELEKNILREMKLNGLLLADPNLVQMMDRGLSGASDLIPVQLKRDGGFSARSAVLTGQQFALLRAYLRRELLAAGNEIINGVVDIAPYRQGDFRSCRYCLFRAVCLFDELVEGNVCRRLQQVSQEDVWGKLAELCGGDHGV